MNVFVPYQSPIDCAKALYGDKRFQKQIIECEQILKAIGGYSKSWLNHPVTKMYSEYSEWLREYMICFKYYKDYKNGMCSITVPETFSERADSMRPPFLTDEFCNQHKRRLFSKNPKHYTQFAEYGTSEENWYVINNEIVKYKDGKRINY